VVRIVNRWVLTVLLLAGAMSAQAAAKVVWSGDSGGYNWVWTDSNLTATRPDAKVPSLSLRQLLRTEPDKEVQTYRSISVQVLSVVGPLASVKVMDEWDGGAHPSGAFWYQTFDARHPKREATLTDYVPYTFLRAPLYADKVVGGILRKKGWKQAPKTSAEFERALDGEVFEVDQIEHQFGKHPLTEFSFHHVEGDQVAIRLNVGWGKEANRFQTTQIGFLAPIPPQLKGWMTRSAAGTAGFLTRTSVSRFAGKTISLLEWSKGER
jgi:hypothetical protein